MHQVREELKANDPNVVMPADFERYYWAIGFFTGRGSCTSMSPFIYLFIYLFNLFNLFNYLFYLFIYLFIYSFIIIMLSLFHSFICFYLFNIFFLFYSFVYCLMKLIFFVFISIRTVFLVLLTGRVLGCHAIAPSSRGREEARATTAVRRGQRVRDVRLARVR
jgi:hypothetical protein